MNHDYNNTPSTIHDPSNQGNSQTVLETDKMTRLKADLRSELESRSGRFDFVAVSHRSDGWVNTRVEKDFTYLCALTPHRPVSTASEAISKLEEYIDKNQEWVQKTEDTQPDRLTEAIRGFASGDAGWTVTVHHYTATPPEDHLLASRMRSDLFDRHKKKALGLITQLPDYSESDPPQIASILALYQPTEQLFHRETDGNSTAAKSSGAVVGVPLSNDGDTEMGDSTAQGGSIAPATDSGSSGERTVSRTAIAIADLLN